MWILVVVLVVLIMLLVYTRKRRRYAVCLYGQPRAVGQCIETFYKHLVRPLDADVFITCNYSNTSIDRDIDLYEENVVGKVMYDAPDPVEFFKNKLELSTNNDNNWRKYSGLQMFIAYKMIAEKWGSVLKDYDMIITVRTDHKFLVDFPDILSLYRGDDKLWKHKGNDWGGINYNLVCVPRKYIIEFLEGPYHYIVNSMDAILKLEPLNSESFIKHLFESKGWSPNTIDVNGFFTADSVDSITTWAAIKKSEKHGVLYKYEDQLDWAFENLEKFKNGKTWSYKDNSIVLA